eukprot:174398-Chlamydomonas_euryale.AAC.1
MHDREMHDHEMHDHEMHWEKSQRKQEVKEHTHRGRMYWLGRSQALASLNPRHDHGACIQGRSVTPCLSEAGVEE